MNIYIFCDFNPIMEIYCFFFLLHRDRDGEVTERYKHKWTVPLRDVDLKVNSSISNVHNSLSLWTGDSVSTMRTGKANLSFLTVICLIIIITLCQFNIGFFKSFLHLSDLPAHKRPTKKKQKYINVMLCLMCWYYEWEAGIKGFNCTIEYIIKKSC